MSDKEFSGYKGEALNAIKKAEAEIGDMIRVTKDNETYEGILIPSSEYSDPKHIIIKLKNGYNIGIHITPNTKIQKTGKGTKPTFTPPTPPQQNQNLPKIAIISTGGTIASRVDYRTGAVRPALTANDLYSVVPELATIARINTQILFSIFSENMTTNHWTQIAKTTAKQIDTGVEGIVVAHGTDTLGYTAAALSFALQDLPVPVILVGSQRSADRPSSDAATNLIGATTAAAKAPFAEVTVAMHETPSDTTITLYRATKVRKCHTSRRDAFKPINTQPIAKIQNQTITIQTQNYTKRDPTKKLVLKPEFDEKVALLKFHPSMNPKIIDYLIENSYKAIVLEGTGLGHISNQCNNSIKNAIEHNIIIAMTSQCIWGRINMNVYNSGRDLQALGVIPLEDMLSETALVKLMWIFGQTNNTEEAKKLLKTNIANEFSPRILLEKTDNE